MKVTVVLRAGPPPMFYLWSYRQRLNWVKGDVDDLRRQPERDQRLHFCKLPSPLLFGPDSCWLNQMEKRVFARELCADGMFELNFEALISAALNSCSLSVPSASFVGRRIHGARNPQERR